MSRFPPGPRDGWFGLRLSRRLAHEPLAFLTELGRTYGDLAFFRLGPLPVYLANHPDLIHQVLVTQGRCFRKAPRLLAFLRRVDGNGLLVAEGPWWLRQRRRLQPAFAPHRLAHYAEGMVHCIQRTIAGWSPGREIDVEAEMRQLALSVLARTMFGLDLGERAAPLCRAGRVLAEILPQEMAAPLTLPDWLPLPGRRRKRQAIRAFQDVVQDIVGRRGTSPTGDDYLALLLRPSAPGEANPALTDRQVRDEVMTLLHAGHETTGAALTWVWYLLTRHPETADRVIREIDTVLGPRSATLEAVARLAFTERTIKEALRLYPPTWVIFTRKAVGDIELGGYRIPRGAWVYLSPYVTHHDPRFFPDPERFDPDRFAPGRVGQVPARAYFPFGAGPHVCIGSTFAMTLMTLT
ncbi:MAG: cytochrome P450, partial [Planctomycetes bacterium]|nr:cytochrome P450 [Planctomycetota bacterium]